MSKANKRAGFVRYGDKSYCIGLFGLQSEWDNFVINCFNESRVGYISSVPGQAGRRVVVPLHQVQEFYLEKAT